MSWPMTSAQQDAAHKNCMEEFTILRARARHAVVFTISVWLLLLAGAALLRWLFQPVGYQFSTWVGTVAALLATIWAVETIYRAFRVASRAVERLEARTPRREVL